MKFSQWINSRMGKGVDYDGVYGVQCVDLVDDYIVNCLGLKIGFYGNAKEWWLKRNSSSWLKNNFDFLNPQSTIAQKGDIGVRTSGTYGHIFVIGGWSDNKIIIYDQNATGNHDKVTMRTITNTSDKINGILRPKKQSNIDKWGTHIIKNSCDVYSCSDMRYDEVIGALYKGDEIKYLGTANGHTMVVYPVGKYYKIGIIRKGNIE